MLFTMKTERDEMGGDLCKRCIFFLRTILVVSPILASRRLSGNDFFNLVNSYHVVYLYTFTKFLALGVLSQRGGCK